MRATILAACAACVVLSAPTLAAAPIPTNSDEATLMQMEALGDRWPDRWQGRQNYLYDDHYQPGTTGASPNDARACSDRPVRVKRSDGSTVLRRVKRCD